MNIEIYTKSNCPNCVSAKQLLKSKWLPFLEIDSEAERDRARFEHMLEQNPGVRQMPQIFIDGQRVGGLAGLQAALAQLGR